MTSAMKQPCLNFILLCYKNRYLKAAKVGEEVLVEASTLKTGKNLAYLHVDIKNKATDELIARGSHTKFIGSPVQSSQMK